MVLNKKTKWTGKERGLPKSFANRPRLVSRVGVYTGFEEDNSFKVCWGGLTATGSAQWAVGSGYTGTVFEDRNLLIHWIRCLNNNDKDKEIHFWQNNYDADQSVTSGGQSQKGDVTHADYLFNVSMAAGEGKHDIKLDFPLPLLVMGGCTIAVRDVFEHNNTDKGIFGSVTADYDCVVQICYTVLNSTPVNAPYKRLKYKFLSAFSFSGGGTTYSGSGLAEFSGDKSVIRPDTASGVWYEDIELWGGTIMNRINPAGGSDGKVAQARVKNAANEIVCTTAVVKGPANAIPLPIVVHTGSAPLYAPSIFGWCHGLRIGTLGEWRSWGGDIWTYITTFGVSGDMVLPPITLLTTNFKMYDAGSDTQVSMFRFPVYVKGAGTSENFKVSVSGAAAEDTKSTWFYRPARKKGLKHRWI